MYMYFFSQDALTEDSIVKFMPDKSTTLDMLIVAKVLSERETFELGNYEVQYAYDPQYLSALKG